MEESLSDNKVYIELREILKYTEYDILKKIPQRVLDILNSINDTNYNFKYDFSKSLNEQKIQTKTKELLAGLYIKYCCDEKKAQELIKKCKENDEKFENQFEVKFRNERKETVNDIPENINQMENETGKELIVVKKNIFSAIINKIKEFFRR